MSDTPSLRVTQPTPTLMFSSKMVPIAPPIARLPQSKIKGNDRHRLEPDATEWPQAFQLRKEFTPSDPRFPLDESQIVIGRMKMAQLCFGLGY
jgi:hypothetical protein